MRRSYCFDLSRLSSLRIAAIGLLILLCSFLLLLAES